MTPAQDADPTVGAGDIARLAGVGRAAVSNWRRRFDDFPEPVGGSAASLRYRLADVERWLAEHDRAASVPPSELAWQALRAEAGDLELGEAVAAAGAVLLGADDDLRLSADVRTRVREAARDAGADTVHEYLVDRYLDAYSRRLTVVPARLARTMVRIASAGGRTVLDPACGTGSLLRAAAAGGATKTSGQERDPVAAEIAGHRVRLAPGVGGNVATGDALRADAYPDRRVGAVVSVPPFADRNWGHEELAGDPRWLFGLPPRPESELAWIQHCLAHVDDGGTVVLQVPAGVAFRRSGRRIRNELLRAGALDAVIGLPRDAGVPTDLWVLHRPVPGTGPPENVLIALATRHDDAADIWARHRSGTDTTTTARAVPVLDLLDEEVDLSPERHVRAELERPDHAAASDRLRRALDALPPPPELRPTDRGPAPATTIGDLVKAGIVAVLQTPVRQEPDPPSGDDTVPVLTTHDIQKRREPSGRTGATTPGLVLLQPGDVVVPVPAVRGAEAFVVPRAGAALGPRTQVLRPDHTRLDPHYLAGVLRAASAVEVRPTGRSDVRRLAMAMLPIERQRELGEAFRRLAELDTGLREVRRAGEALVRGALQGIGAGTLEPRR